MNDRDTMPADAIGSATHHPPVSVAFVRAVSFRLADCQLTHLARSAIDPALAQAQHGCYARALRELGAELRFLPALPDSPDGVFVEDTAIVLPQAAVITRPGASSRRSEVESVAASLAGLKPLVRISAPACLEGGDVLRIGRQLFVGASTRTNDAGIADLRACVQRLGYDVLRVEIRGCLHLKTACTFIPPGFVVANPSWVDVTVFRNWRVIAVDGEEPFAGNTLTVGRTTLVSADCPLTERRLRNAGILTRTVDISELQKAEAGLTCLSIIA